MQKLANTPNQEADEGATVNPHPLAAVKATATPPTTLEEITRQIDLILIAIGNLEQVADRHRYISPPEVTNLRAAFEFAICEERSHSQAASSPTVSGQCSSSKATEADTRLTALEAYVAAHPASASFDLSSPFFSWQSVLHTPGERRLQSVMVSVFNFLTGIPLFVTAFVLLLCCRYTMPFAALYLFYIFVLDRPVWPIKKRMALARLSVWHYYRDYFPVRLVIPQHVQQQFDASKNYFFVYHPHGVHSFGAIINFGLDANDSSKLLPGIKTHAQTLRSNFYIPFWRFLGKIMGLGDASAECIRATLRAGPGESVVLVVGGAEESLMAQPKTNDLLLVKRKGFVKIALQEGSPLVPVYGFGENNVYNIPKVASHPLVQRVMAAVRSATGFVIPIVSGRSYFTFGFGLMPHRRPIVVVVGEPIIIPRIANPTAEDLEHWQQEYICALQRLYERHRGIYDLESTGLRIMK